MLRKTISLTSLLSFILLMLTSVILYIVPAGRVAYWADYHLWGLTKTQWGNLHINLGVLFFLAIIIHTFYNWKAITAYLKNKSKKFRLFTAEFNFALLVTLLFSVGTYLEVPPFSTIISIGSSISAEAEAFYGEPPYGHAELSSLQTFTKKMELDLTSSLQRLKDANLEVSSSGQSILEIAKANEISPKEIYLAISPLEERIKTFPKEPPSGLGKRPLIDLCQEYSVNIKTVLNILSTNGVKAEETMSIKEIADLSQKDPIAVYELIRSNL